MLSLSPLCYVPRFTETGPLVTERILKCFYSIWAWRPCMSCDPDAANNFLSPFNHGHSPQNLALIGLVVSEKNIFENGRRRQRPRTDGRHWIIAHTVQSRVFSPTPWRIVLSPLPSNSVVHRGPTADPPRTVAVPRR